MASTASAHIAGKGVGAQSVDWDFLRGFRIARIWENGADADVTSHAYLAPWIPKVGISAVG